MDVLKFFAGPSDLSPEENKKFEEIFLNQANSEGGITEGEKLEAITRILARHRVNQIALLRQIRRVNFILELIMVMLAAVVIKVIFFPEQL